MLRAHVVPALLVGLHLLASAAVAADESTPHLIAKAPDAASHPQASAIGLLNNVRLEVNEKFGTTKEVRQVVKILTSQGREDYGQLRIAYDAGEETVEILKAVTYDGQNEIAAPQEGITEITPPGDAAAKMYTNQKIKVISMPALKEGVTIELIYRVKRAKPKVEGKFADAFNLQDTVPMQTVRYSLVVPQHIRFKHVVERAECAPDVAQDGDRTVYRWERRNVPAIVPEPYTPSPAELVPWLYITNWESWEEVGDWYASLAAPGAQVNDALRGFVADVTKSKDTEQARMAALYHAIAAKIRYVSLSFGMGGYRPHSAAETLKNRYGDCKDKATLVVAALSELGITAHMVLINSTTQEISRNAPWPGAFNHAIVAVPVGNEYLWLDPTSETCSFGDLPAEDQNKLALVVKRGASRLVKTPLVSASKNVLSVVFNGEVADDGNLQGTMTWKNLGSNDSLFRGILRGATPAERRQWLTGFVAKVAGGSLKVTDVALSDVDDLSTPLTITLKFKGEGYTTDVGDLLMVKFPDFPFLDPTLAQITAAKERQYAAFMGSTVSLLTEVSLRLPVGYQTQSLPHGAARHNSVGEYVSTYAVEDGALKMRRQFVIDLERVPAAKYPQLKELVTAKATELRKQLVLKKGGKG
jgi:hypothetical protein